MALQQIDLSTGPDQPGADTLYEGFTKVNGNWAQIASPTVGEGAALVALATGSAFGANVQVGFDLLESTTATEGSALIGFSDPNGVTVDTNVEDVLTAVVPRAGGVTSSNVLLNAAQQIAFNTLKVSIVTTNTWTSTATTLFDTSTLDFKNQLDEVTIINAGAFAFTIDDTVQTDIDLQGLNTYTIYPQKYAKFVYIGVTWVLAQEHLIDNIVIDPADGDYILDPGVV